MTEELVKQRVAARALDVSVSWLRASECPKVSLPGNGPKRKPVIRYRMSDVWRWAEENEKRSTRMRRVG